MSGKSVDSSRGKPLDLAESTNLPAQLQTMKKSESASTSFTATSKRSRQSSQEELKLTSSNDHSSSTNSNVKIPGAGRKKRPSDPTPPSRSDSNISLGSSLHSRKSSMNPEQVIESAIRSMLQPYTLTPQTSLEEVNKLVSQIYETVGNTVADVLKDVMVQQNTTVEHVAEREVSTAATEHSPIRVTATVKSRFHDEETFKVGFPVRCTSAPSVSSTPTFGIGRPDTGGSVRPDSGSSVPEISAPQSGSSKRSIHFIQSAGSERPDSVKTDASGPHSSLSRSSFQYLKTDEPIECSSPTTITSITDEDVSAKKISSVKDPQNVKCISADFEVTCGCHLSPLIYDKKLYVPKTSTTGNDVLKIYDLISGQESDSCDLKKTETLPSYAACKMFYLKNTSLLAKSTGNAAKISLYQLDTKASPASWELISRPSVPPEIKSFIPVSYKDDAVITVSVVNHKSSDIVFHIFSHSKSEKQKSSTSQIHHPAADYQIQSCTRLLNFIYCGLLQPGKGAHIYRFDVASLQKETHSAQPSWFIRNSTLKNCFLSVLEGDIFVISIFTNNKKSVMKTQRLLDNSEISSVEHHIEFPNEVTVVTASVISVDKNRMVVMMYHDKISNRCHIKRVSIV